MRSLEQSTQSQARLACASVERELQQSRQRQRQVANEERQLERRLRSEIAVARAELRPQFSAARGVTAAIAKKRSQAALRWARQELEHLQEQWLSARLVNRHRYDHHRAVGQHAQSERAAREAARRREHLDDAMEAVRSFIFVAEGEARALGLYSVDADHYARRVSEQIGNEQLRQWKLSDRRSLQEFISQRTPGREGLERAVAPLQQAEDDAREAARKARKRAEVAMREADASLVAEFADRERSAAADLERAEAAAATAEQAAAEAAAKANAAKPTSAGAARPAPGKTSSSASAVSLVARIQAVSEQTSEEARSGQEAARQLLADEAQQAHAKATRAVAVAQAAGAKLRRLQDTRRLMRRVAGWRKDAITLLDSQGQGVLAARTAAVEAHREAGQSRYPPPPYARTPAVALARASPAAHSPHSLRPRL